MYGQTPSEARATENLDRRRFLSPLDKTVVAALLACRAVGKLDFDDDIELRVRALNRVAEAAEITDRWVGVHSSQPQTPDVQVFCGEPIGGLASSPVDHPFSVTLSRGSYLEVHVTDGRSHIEVITARAWSTFWLRMGTLSPPSRILFKLSGSTPRLLIPFE